MKVNNNRIISLNKSVNFGVKKTDSIESFVHEIKVAHPEIRQHIDNLPIIKTIREHDSFDSLITKANNDKTILGNIREFSINKLRGFTRLINSIGVKILENLNAFGMTLSPFRITVEDDKTGEKKISNIVRIAYQKKYRLENKEKQYTYNKKYYLHNIEKLNESKKKYNLEYKEERKESNKKYYQEHKEERKAYRKKYNLEHKEKRNANKQKDYLNRIEEIKSNKPADYLEDIEELYIFRQEDYLENIEAIDAFKPEYYKAIEALDIFRQEDYLENIEVEIKQK